MKSKNKFVIALIIFAGVLIVAGGAFLIYVNTVVSDYDMGQPERLIEKQIAGLKSGELLSEIDFLSLCDNRYENNDPDMIREDYSSKVVGKEITYKIVTSESSELSKTYVLISGEENIGKLRLEGKNTVTRLFFFTSADWSLGDFTPIITDTVYNLKIYCPSGVTARINGIEPTEEERGNAAPEESGTPFYNITGLLNDPEISYTDKNGNEVAYTVENNTVKPILFDYRIVLPKGLGVKVNGNAAEGIESADGEVFTVREMEKPEVIITDILGSEYRYVDGEEIPLFEYKISIPEGCTLSVGGTLLSDHVTANNPDAEQLLKYAGVTLPKDACYTFSLFRESVEAVVSNGSKSAGTDVRYGDSRLSPEALDEVPEDIANEIDVLYVMKLWSKFMTNDIGGGDNGLSVVAKYLIPNSEYYTYARQWAYGIDIMFIAAHVTLGFTNENVSNFISYGDNCFSCDVYFEKNMNLFSNEIYVGKKTDVFNSIVYFTKIEDGSWRIAVMHENLAGEEEDA